MTTNTEGASGPTTKQEREVFHNFLQSVHGDEHVTPAKIKSDPTTMGGGKEQPATPPTVESAESVALDDSPALAPRRLDPDLAGDACDGKINNSSADGGGGGADKSSPSPSPETAAAIDAAEIDLLIQQLDEVEADFTIKLEAAETTIREKDAIIGAIGHNITELKTENARLRQDLQLQKDVLEMTQQDLDKANGRLVEAREEIAQQAEKYEALIDQEVHRLESKAKQVEQDVVSQAQEQFAEAKLAYDALLAQKNELKLERNNLSKQLQATKDESKKIETKAKSTEADLMATIASLRAEVAAADARAMSHQRECKVSSEEAEDRIRVLEEALERSERERMDMKKDWVSVRTKEERLVKENAELSALCEELMTIVEGANGEK